MTAEAPRPVSLQRLRLLPSLINQAVGDALSDLLLVDAILHIKGWDLATWNALYTDMPSRMSKMKVTDRKYIVAHLKILVLVTWLTLTFVAVAVILFITCFPAGTIVKTSENDTECLAPANVQKELDAAMKEYNGRSFIRPSGTEDVVRVYAEAETRDATNQLAAKAEQIVYSLCGGIGDPPVFPASRM